MKLAHRLRALITLMISSHDRMPPHGRVVLIRLKCSYEQTWKKQNKKIRIQQRSCMRLHEQPDRWFHWHFECCCFSVSCKPPCSWMQEDPWLSESAHVLNHMWATLVLLIDDQESVAGFYILITVSARYWFPSFSNMVDSDLCNILHLHSSILL